MSHLMLDLYTRPTCSDCQDAKKYLKESNINYSDLDVSKNPELEKELMKLSGTRVLPFFVFYKKGMFGRKKIYKTFLGDELNKDEIEHLLN